jgi:UDP-glucose 4-epimerase
MINDEDTYLTGKGLISRDYVYVDDVVEANVKALELEQTGIFNIATGIEVDLHYIFDKLSSITGYKKPKVLADFKLGEQLRSVCTSKKFSDLTGWSPKIILEQGLAETYKYYKSLVS